MLAALSILGLTDIHQMNGLKNFFALCINGVAAMYFIFAHMVQWPYVLTMGRGSDRGRDRWSGFGTPHGSHGGAASGNRNRLRDGRVVIY